MIDVQDSDDIATLRTYPNRSHTSLQSAMKLLVAVNIGFCLLVVFPPAFKSAFIAPRDAAFSPLSAEDTSQCHTQCTDVLDKCIDALGCDDDNDDGEDDDGGLGDADDDDDGGLEDFWEKHVHVKCLENCWNLADSCNQRCLAGLISSAEVA